jgi:hypothetical protein
VRLSCGEDGVVEVGWRLEVISGMCAKAATGVRRKLPPLFERARGIPCTRRGSEGRVH